MGDNWEDWDSEDEIAVPAPIVARPATNVDKFADEDADVTDGPKWEGTVPETKAKKVVVSKYDESRGVQKPRADDTPLDDPIAEKLRQQRLVEEADYAATMELFGSSRELEGFIPKTNKEFEELGKLVAAKYLISHASAKGYKSAMKALLAAALHDMSAADVKDIETCVAGIRSERLKAEKTVSAMGKKQIKKASLNTGMKTKGTSAGLDDIVYDDDLDDDFDFM